MRRIAPQSFRQALMRGLVLLAIAGLLALLALLFAVPAAHGQVPDTLQASMFPTDGIQIEARLGARVAVDDQYIVAGAPYDDTGGRDAGVVKIFDSSTGALLFVLTNPNPERYDYFGSPVAISGNWVVVGEPGNDTGAPNAGAVYVYDLSSAAPTVPVFTLKNSIPLADDYFGRSVGISGTRVIVGATGGSVGTSVGGTVYVYDLRSLNPASPVLALRKPNPASGDRFGGSLAISGTRVVVGVDEDRSVATNVGSAYVYDLGGVTPQVPVAILRNPTTNSYDYFGASVAISGTRVVIGAYRNNTKATAAGSAYVYDLDNGTPTAPILTLRNPSPGSNDYFGGSVAISGTRVIVGAGSDDYPQAVNAGSAYVYDLGSAARTKPALTLSKFAPAMDDNFGNSVAISGMRLVVSASGDDTTGLNNGSVFRYDLGSPTPTEPVRMLDAPGPEADKLFGASMAMSGTWLAVGAPFQEGRAGRVYVYDLASATPSVPVFTLKNDYPLRGEGFGTSVAISGKRLVVGAPLDEVGAFVGGILYRATAGRAYVYDLGSTPPTVPIATLTNPKPDGLDYFGNAVAISGTQVAVGADREGSDEMYGAGSVYVYDLAKANPKVPALTLSNPSPEFDDRFGNSVAISGARVVVGAALDNGPGINCGRAYVYDLLSATPKVPVVTLNNPTPVDDGNFGNSVAISGTRVVVGARGNRIGTANGHAYVYDLASTWPTLPVALLNKAGAANRDFGSSVAISGTRVAVSASLVDPQALDAGIVYVYDLGSATPSVPVVTLNNPRSRKAAFGVSVGIEGTTVAVGSPDDDVGMADAGAVDLFAPANPDFDGDGLLDLWEYARFGSITAHTASDDTDGDGRQGLLELAFDTNPLLPDPAPVLAPVLVAGHLTVTLNKRAGVSYCVESAGSLDSGAFSTATTTTLTNDAKTLKVRDKFTIYTAGQRFMRVKVDSEL